MIRIDFETRSKVRLEETGAWVYAEDSSTDILCMAVEFAAQEGIFLLKPPEIPFNPRLRIHRRLYCAITSGSIFEAHNAFFEEAVWYCIMHQRHGWPAIPIHQWRCSMAKANAHALPRSLFEAAVALELPVKKDLVGRRIMFKLARPRKPTKHDSRIWFDDEEDIERLYKYCIKDVVAERWVSEALRDLHPQEQEIWFLDQKINMRGIRIDRIALNGALSIMEKQTKAFDAEVKRITKGELSSVRQRDRVLMWIEDNGIDMGGYTKDDVSQALERTDLSPVVRRVLEIRQELGRVSIAKYKAMQKNLCHDGRIRGTLMYHGASTGRWSGMHVQFHNFPQGTIKNANDAIDLIKAEDIENIKLFYGNVFELLSSCLRGMIIPSRNHDLYVGDFKAIEAIVIWWLAGDKAALSMANSGSDMYRTMASLIYGKKFNDITKKERELGKRTILGCGFGMGWKKFKETCKTYANLEISENLAQRAVSLYRDKFYKVRQLWYDQEAAAIMAVKTGKVIRSGKIKWGVRDRFLYAKLPSGRTLAYYKPEIAIIRPFGYDQEALCFMDIYGPTRTFKLTSTWGGTLAENITQATARDILAEAMLRLDKHHYGIILTVHDEVLSEKEKGQGSLDEFLALLTEKPPWAQDLPIMVEAWRGDRYHK